MQINSVEKTTQKTVEMPQPTTTLQTQSLAIHAGFVLPAIAIFVFLIIYATTNRINNENKKLIQKIMIYFGLTTTLITTLSEIEMFNTNFAQLYTIVLTIFLFFMLDLLLTLLNKNKKSKETTKDHTTNKYKKIALPFEQKKNETKKKHKFPAKELEKILKTERKRMKYWQKDL